MWLRNFTIHCNFAFQMPWSFAKKNIHTSVDLYVGCYCALANIKRFFSRKLIFVLVFQKNYIQWLLVISEFIWSWKCDRMKNILLLVSIEIWQEEGKIFGRRKKDLFTQTQLNSETEKKVTHKKGQGASHVWWWSADFRSSSIPRHCTTTLYNSFFPYGSPTLVITFGLIYKHLWIIHSKGGVCLHAGRVASTLATKST